MEVSRVVWVRHEQDLRASGDLFYAWQYDIRWAAQKAVSETRHTFVRPELVEELKVIGDRSRM